MMIDFPPAPPWALRAEARLPRWPHMRACRCRTVWCTFTYNVFFYLCCGSIWMSSMVHNLAPLHWYTHFSSWKAHWCIPDYADAAALHSTNCSKMRRVALRWHWFAILNHQKLERRAAVPCTPFWLSLATPSAPATRPL